MKEKKRAKAARTTWLQPDSPHVQGGESVCDSHMLFSAKFLQMSQKETDLIFRRKERRTKNQSVTAIEGWPATSRTTWKPIKVTVSQRSFRRGFFFAPLASGKRQFPVPPLTAATATKTTTTAAAAAAAAAIALLKKKSVSDSPTLQSLALAPARKHRGRRERLPKHTFAQ